MVCSTAILTSSLALSLLRHSSPPNQSFVLSPFSFNTALAITHDGANGETQKELTNLLLNGCSPSDVTLLYSKLATSLSSANDPGVTIKSANRFYVDDSISLKSEYQRDVEDKYKVKVENLDLQNRNNAASAMNKFIEGATNGMIKDVVKADQITVDDRAFLINAIHFLGKWKYSFNPTSTHTGFFNGTNGKREMQFMLRDESKFRVNWYSDFGTALLVPYQDEKYHFFYLMPKRTSNLDELRSKLTGEDLISVLRNAEDMDVEVIVPKFKLESELDGVKVLSKLGVHRLFSNNADLSQITSDDHLKITSIQHNAVIEVDEQGTEAAAVTIHKFTTFSGGPPTIVIDRPFLFGIIRDEDIIFLGQFA